MSEPIQSFSECDSRGRWYRAGASHLWAAGMLGLIVLLYNHVPLWHTDVWGHLAFGRWMVENGRLPRVEPLTPFADGERPYVHFQWLTQAGGYLAYHLGETLAGGSDTRRTQGGVMMLHAVHGLLGLVVYAALLAALARRAGSLRAACLGLMLTLLLRPAFTGIYLRPELVALACFAVLLVPLSRPVLSRRALVLVPAVMVFWANAHGSFGVGLLTLAGLLAGGLFDGDRDQRRRLIWAFVFSTIGIGLLNPHGPWLYLHVLEMGSNPNVRDMIEWHPLTGPAVGPGIWWGLILGFVVLAVSRAASGVRFRTGDLIVLLGFLVLAVLQRRMLTWWLILVPWAVMPMWPAIAGRLGWAALRWRSRPDGTKAALLAGMVVGVLLLSAPGRWLTGGGPWPLAGSVSAGTPWRLASELTADESRRGRFLPELAEALAEHYPEGRYVGTIFATETQGDYLLWSRIPDAPLFAYSHVHLFTPEHWSEVMRVRTGAEDWRAILDRAGANLVVAEPGPNPGLVRRLADDPDWLLFGEGAGRGDPRTPVRVIGLRKAPIRPARAS